MYINGDKFSGEWCDDKASGVGTLEYSNGDIYDGKDTVFMIRIINSLYQSVNSRII